MAESEQRLARARMQRERPMPIDLNGSEWDYEPQADARWGIGRPLEPVWRWPERDGEKDGSKEEKKKKKKAVLLVRASARAGRRKEKVEADNNNNQQGRSSFSWPKRPLRVHVAA